MFVLLGGRAVRCDAGADSQLKKHKMIARVDSDTNIVFIKPAFCFPADHPCRGQWSWEDVSVGAVRPGKVHPRLLFCNSGHRIHGVFVYLLHTRPSFVKRDVLFLHFPLVISSLVFTGLIVNGFELSLSLSNVMVSGDYQITYLNRLCNAPQITTIMISKCLENYTNIIC